MKSADEVTLDDVGAIVIADVELYPVPKNIIRRVQMVIKAPRGRLIIYGPTADEKVPVENARNRGRAIKFFVDEHLHD